jgi:hypothetical protein
MKRKIVTAKSAPVALADAPVAETKKAFVFRVTVTEWTYLRIGDVFLFNGSEHVVRSVNDSCARIVPLTEGTPKQVTFKPKFADKAVTFTAPERNTALSISANSEVPLLRRLGTNWRAQV